MKKYLIQYKPFLLFLTKFFLTYTVLTLIYQAYLGTFGEGKIDSITRSVSNNTEYVLNFFHAEVATLETRSYIKLFYNKEYVARIIEGCNGISVIILFISFVVSFSGKLKQTILFVFVGSFVVYILNVFRIAALCALIYYLPNQQSILHSIVFPLFIYGVVFILWLIWINKFSLYAKSNAKS